VGCASGAGSPVACRHAAARPVGERAVTTPGAVAQTSATCPRPARAFAVLGGASVWHRVRRSRNRVPRKLDGLGAARGRRSSALHQALAPTSAPGGFTGQVSA